MSTAEPIPLAHACRLLNHGPTVIVSAAHGGRRNLMAAAWSMPVEFEPPRVAVVIDKSTFTRTLVEASGEFALSIPCRALADLTYTVGSVSGREMDDKFARYRIGAFAGRASGAPLVEGCIGWLECRLIPEPHLQQAYDNFIGEVVAAAADPRVFSGGRWHVPPELPELSTLHHIAGGAFFRAADPLQARKLA
jgi:flavin reductase (DIM6/NTAB) family NADH-FMN oxidoreductase RutF